jgi:CBS domain-containing protein
MRLNYVRATSLAASIGRGTAILLGIYGLFGGGFFMLLIAVFIYMGAGQEAMMVRVRDTLRGFRVHQAYTPSAYRLTPYSNLQQVVNLMLFSGQKSFPVVQGDKLVGFISELQLTGALRQRDGHTWVNTIMEQVEPVTPTTDMYDVQKRLDAERQEALPVVGEDGRFLGLVSRQNLLELQRVSAVAPNAVPRMQSA